MKWISLFFISVSAYSLEIGERVNFKVRKILPENIIEINLDQGEQIKINEQVKIYKDKTFVSRALCIKIERSRSFWKLFRVVKPETLNKNKEFMMKAIPLKDVPWEYFDRSLPEYRKIVAEFNPAVKTIEEDVVPTSSFETRIFASPIRMQSQNDYSEFHFGLETTKTKINDEYDVKLGLEGFRFDATDAATNETYAQTSTFIELMATNTKVFDDVNVFFGIDFYTQKQNDIYPYKNQYRVYPFGIEKRYTISKLIPKLSFFYSPIIETWEMQEANALNLIITTDTALRHMLGFSLVLAPSKQIEIENRFKIRPLHETDDVVKIVFDDLDFSNSLMVKYFASKNFYVDYTNTYSLDQRRELYTNLDEGNIIHSFNLNYRFSN